MLNAGEYFQDPALFYWMREAKSAAAEIDYLLTVGQDIIPIEIKAGATGTLRSLHQFCQEKQCKCALRFNSDKPSVIKDASATTTQGKLTYNLLSLPLYMAGEAKRLAEELLNVN